MLRGTDRVLFTRFGSGDSLMVGTIEPAASVNITVSHAAHMLFDVVGGRDLLRLLQQLVLRASQGKKRSVDWFLEWQ
jgi:hypothetical protein